MPLPKPTNAEKQAEFVDRCMSDDETLKEFPDEKQRVAVCIGIYTREKDALETSNANVSERVEKGLKKKLEDHREKVGKDPRKQTTLRKLKIVYNRGIGAYRTNPSSVRPSVGSPEQWANARVNSFLHALRNLRYRSGKHDTDLLPKDHPIRKSIDKDKASLDEHRRYEDGEIIPSALPPAYRKSRKDGETKGQACINCKFYKEDQAEHRFYCTHWKAPIRPQYWCKAWKAKADALAETYNDYPESASNNAKKVLRWKEEHGDEVKGMTQVGWTRANQLAKRERISRETIARMASFKRHQKNAEIDPKFKGTPWKDKGYVAWLGWGGTSGVEWAIRKLKQIDKKANSKMSSKQYGFSALNISESKIDKDSGKMFGVSLISVGEALGHELFVDDDSLDTILESIEGEKLPAYITHRGALFEDRLTREIGMFTNFRTEGDRLMADFEAFDSFREDDTRKFNRLFEMAEKMPEKFGLSIVFSATHAWATPEGDVELDAKPDNALFDFPSIRVQEVTSADFVDTPAANQKGLFSQTETKPTNKMLKSELIEANEKLSAENEALKAKIEENESIEQQALEAQVSQEEAQIESSNEVQEETSSEQTQESFDKHEDEEMNVADNEKTINKGGSQGLGGHEDEEKLEEEEAQEEEESLEDKVASLESVIASLEEQLKEKDEEMSKLQESLEGHEKEEEEMKAELSKATEENSKLSALIKGANPVEVSKEDDSTWSPSSSTKDQFIRDYAKKNNISEFTATLRLGKEKPELFNL
jgi:hypothetical protein